MIGYDVFEQRYMDYAATFRQPDGTLPEPMQRKLEHTMEVVRFAERIASAEGAGENEYLLCRIKSDGHVLTVGGYDRTYAKHLMSDCKII